MVMNLAMLMVLWVFSAFALAEPAPWYRWQSKINRTIVCAQVSPGEGWERYSGPYKDSRCARPGIPGQ